MARVDVVQVLSEAVMRAECAPFVDGEGAGRIVIKAAPGRLDVMGAMGAEAGGTVAQMAVPARVAVAVQGRADRVIMAVSEGMSEPEVRIGLEGLERGEVLMSGGEWGRRILGVWQSLAAAGVSLPAGLGVRIHSAIPQGAGQGSSTALAAALVRGILELCERTMPPEEIAGVVARAEAFTGFVSHNGRMLDALTCLLAEAGHMLRYSAQPHRLVGAVPVPPDLRILALDTGTRSEGKERETLEELRVAGAMGVRIIDQVYRDLGQAHTPLHGYLANTSPLLYRQYFRMLLPKRLRGSDFVRTYGGGAGGEGMALSEEDTGKFYRVRTAVDHLIAEHEHAEQFVQAMEELADMPGWGDADEEAERQRTLQRAGRLALASHHSYRLRLELSCREADWLVDKLMEAGPERGIYGARITGSGGGGTVMALVHRDQGKKGGATDAVLEVMTAYQREMGKVLGVAEAGASGSVEAEGRGV